jgi:hypothetical protein
MEKDYPLNKAQGLASLLFKLFRCTQHDKSEL